MTRSFKEFKSLLSIIEALPVPVPNDKPLRTYMPGKWPTVGDLRELLESYEKFQPTKGTVFHNFGWVNGWSETPELVKKCQELGHKISDESDAPRVPYKCFNHTVRCDICGYVYKYDSS